MKNFKTILTALDLTEMDETLLNFARFFGQKSAAEQLYFAHIIPSFVLPQGVKDIVHSVVSPGFQLDEMVREKMVAEIKAGIGDALKTPVQTVVEEGQTFKNLVKLCKQTEAELLLIGKKKTGQSSGIVAKMVARMVDSAVCFVTENARPVFENILVPMDFSDFSVRAIKTAQALTAGKAGTKITAIHVLDYPPTAEYLTRKYGLLAPDWASRLEGVFSKCLAQHEVPLDGVEFVPIKNEYFNTAQHILEYAQQNNKDSIIVGAKGHHAFDDLFLGSVTEKLVMMADSIPVLIVR